MQHIFDFVFTMLLKSSSLAYVFLVKLLFSFGLQLIPRLLTPVLIFKQFRLLNFKYFFLAEQANKIPQNPNLLFEGKSFIVDDVLRHELRVKILGVKTVQQFQHNSFPASLLCNLSKLKVDLMLRENLQGLASIVQSLLWFLFGIKVQKFSQQNFVDLIKKPYWSVIRIMKS